MKKYFVFIRQDIEGCDYTIGCGMTGKTFEAENEFELYKKVLEFYEDYKTVDDIEIQTLYWTEMKNMKEFKGEEIEEYEKYLELKNKFED